MTRGATETLAFTTYKIPYVYDGSPPGARPLLADMVIAIDAPVINDYVVQRRYPRLAGGEEAQSTWRLTMSLEAARRLLAFYNMTMGSPRVRGQYECHTFPSFVAGVRDRLGKGQGVEYGLGERVFPYDLTAAESFMMLDDRGAGKHATLGMGSEYPRHCLGVLGGNGILAVTNTIQTMDTFEATHIAPIYYDALVQPAAR